MARADTKQAEVLHEYAAIRVLLIDEEERFRVYLRSLLDTRGFDIREADSPEEGMRILRQEHQDVVIFDRKMSTMSGVDMLREIKRVAADTQVVMLTGHASKNSAIDKIPGVFAFLEKPCETEGLVATLRAAARHRQQSAALLSSRPKPSSVWAWLKGTHNFRPGVMILGAILFTMTCLAPTPPTLLSFLNVSRLEQRQSDPIASYARYSRMKPGETIAAQYSTFARQQKKVVAPDGTVIFRPLDAQEVGFRARVMLGILVLAGLFWATGALPFTMTAMLVGFLMYVFRVFSPDMVAKAFAKDSVLFILGILALSVGIMNSKLDRRLGLLLLRTSTSLPRYLFFFLPLLAVCASFLSEYALVAIITPTLMLAYRAALDSSGLAKDRSLAVLLVLSMCFAANQGGPGSPAAGGHNAIMMGILADYGKAPSFSNWLTYGLPFVPVMALVIASYFFFVVYRKVSTQSLNIAAILQAESKNQGPLSRRELITIATLVLVLLLWLLGDAVDTGFGLGGPVLLGIVILSVARIITWPDVNKISWDIVALYASAAAIGTGLAVTGASSWLAVTIVQRLPPWATSGEGLAMVSSLLTGLVTNFMSDDAAVATLGPILVPMAQVSETPPWMVGFACAFASSFANVLIIGTPNNVIAYSLAKNPDTGEQLVTLKDFAKHGLIITVLSLLVLWGWALFGYWRWIGFSS